MAHRLDTLSGLLVLAAVVEARSFSGAARLLGVSKSAVSKQISKLEEALGTRLLQRTTRHISLTEAGAALQARGTRILAELDGAEAEVGALGGAPRGHLRVSAPMSFGQRHIAPRLPEFIAAHPGLVVELELSDRFVDLVAERFDCAVRIAHLPDSSLVARRISPARRVVCAAPAYLERRGTPLQPDDLREHDCLDYTYMPTPGGWPFKHGKTARRVAVRGPLQSNNGDVLRAAALDGLGIALLPTFIVGDDLRSGALVPLLRDSDHWDAAIYAVYPPTHHIAPKVRAFIDFLATQCGPNPPWDDWLRSADVPRAAAKPRSRRAAAR